MPVVLVEAAGPDARDVKRIDSPHQSLAEAAHEEPTNGVYLVARTYHGGRVLELDAHFDRLERSAAARGHQIDLPRARIRSVLRDMLREVAPVSGDGRFRVTAVLDDVPWYRLAMEPATGVDPELLQYGVHCSLRRGTVRADAEVKSTAWLVHRRQLNGPGSDGESDGDAVYEHLLAREDGAILEGASSNFYACIGPVVRTADEGVLHGIARRIVLSVIDEIDTDVAVDFNPVTISDLEAGAIDEAFITSATRGVVPVRSIDSVELGDPGPITGKISRHYEAWLERHLRPL